MNVFGPLSTRARSGREEKPGAADRRLSRICRTAILVGTSIAFGVPDGTAQITRPRPNVTVAAPPLPVLIERGWIGVGVDLSVAEGGRGPAGLIIRVVRTVEGGPAAGAGIIPGDVIRAIDGQPITIERWENFSQNLRARAPLRLSLQRAGSIREVGLTTAPRPSSVPLPAGFADHLDSVRTSFRTQLRSNSDVWASRDYLTLLMAAGSVEEVSASILDQMRPSVLGYGFRPGSPADRIAAPERDGDRYSVVWNTDVALPYEYLMLQSPEADSVKTAIIHLREELNAVSEATRVREREIRTIVRFRARDSGDDDAQLLRLRSDNERFEEDLERLAFRLAEIGSSERESWMRPPQSPVDVTVNVRPVSARVVGQNFVGGAQFSELNPQFGQYFGVDRGVLVIQVLSGTPCDEAGLVPGDVVTHVGGTEIDSVEGFRSVLNGVFARGRRADLTLVRRGEQVSATLSR